MIARGVIAVDESVYVFDRVGDDPSKRSVSGNAGKEGSRLPDDPAKYRRGTITATGHFEYKGETRVISNFALTAINEMRVSVGKLARGRCSGWADVMHVNGEGQLAKLESLREKKPRGDNGDDTTGAPRPKKRKVEKLGNAVKKRTGDGKESGGDDHPGQAKDEDETDKIEDGGESGNADEGGDASGSAEDSGF